MAAPRFAEDDGGRVRSVLTRDRVKGVETLGDSGEGFDIPSYLERHTYQSTTPLRDRNTSNPRTTCNPANKIGIHFSMAVTAR